MRAPHVLLLCVLGAALLSSVLCNNALGPSACCFHMYKGDRPKARISSYQLTDSRCPKKGVFFTTKRSRKFCVRPTLGWVQSIMKQLDEESL
ncbi:eotaxin-like [Pleuronectes platessa]|uniref:eotaxin-like n=1 Tax=Pleuronectes platessa TaxID=8262 RepID=UPI00232A19D9|nr:eotaxin-like [Pleuronectes platessa]